MRACTGAIWLPNVGWVRAMWQKEEQPSPSARSWTCSHCGADHDRDLEKDVKQNSQKTPGRPRKRRQAELAKDVEQNTKTAWSRTRKRREKT
ncbi:hypothetical protein AN477_10250 [Alicyclobacillus ferrooxydans]|uniref:Uncharacterized protein n=1 Tax=Alicyclobacillus ferrooxydans TaxID=471514 RepID=A0A0N8PPA3_9BACL|nr:hypothetical protein AN477_10250 [Alicyclobacillus ferrooxydans]